MFFDIPPENSHEETFNYSFSRYHFFDLAVATKLRVTFPLHADCMEQAKTMKALKGKLVFFDDFSLVLAEALRLTG